MTTLPTPPSIEVGRYLVSPRGSVPRILSLTRLLLKYAPAQPSEDLGVRIGELREVSDTARAGVRMRYLEMGPSAAARLAALDSFIDGLERARYARIEHWREFRGAVVEGLAEQQRRSGQAGEVDYVGLLEQAREAERIQALVFAQGTAYTRLPVDEQAEHMRTVADVVEQEGIREGLDRFVGEVFNVVLDDARRRYDDLLEQRAEHQRGSQVDLRVLYSQLQAAIQGYLIALLSMLRADDPDNVAMIRRALRPVDALREQIAIERARAAARNGRAQPAPESEVGADAIEELLAAERATELELGLAAGEAEGTGEPLEPALLDG
jgi:hypothetical protein